MCIEIKYEKFVSEVGEPMVRINKIKALGQDKLPEAYFRKMNWEPFEKFACVNMDYRMSGIGDNQLPYNRILRINAPKIGTTILEEGSNVDYDYFKKVQKAIERAGKRLMKINKKNRKKVKKGWQGQETIKV